MDFGRRPWWMNALFAFCLFMTFVYMPYDMLWKPVEKDQEVWFGYLLHGWAAKATEPLHWAIYAAGAYGFSMASTYNSRRRPAEVLVHGSRAEVVRERETYEDLLKGEKIPEGLKV